VISVGPFFLSTPRQEIEDVVHRRVHPFGLSDKQALEVSGQRHQRVLHIDFELMGARHGFIRLRPIFVFRKTRFDLGGQQAVQGDQHEMGE
jgi:hypothetical protein